MTLKKADQLSAKDLVILGAIFARSNMGHGLPEPRQVELEKIDKVYGSGQPVPSTLDGCVIHFCGHLMESDEHYWYFMEEAKSWVKDLKKDGKTKICQTWPDIAALYWGAEDPVVAGPYAEYLKRYGKKRASYK